MKDILTAKEVAEYLRVSRSSVWRWCRDGTLTSAFRIGRGWRIHRSEIEEIIEQNFMQHKRNVDEVSNND